VLPGNGRNFEQFRADDADCRQWALYQTGTTPNKAGTTSAVTGAAVGTVVGAGLGAAIGAAAGSPATGAAIIAPIKVATLIDGATDYPVAFGRQTYHDSVFRSWSAGDIAADPTNSNHLAVIWSDMRNSTLPAPTDPYSATTNSDVVVSQSADGGAHWSSPVALTLPNDQFQPWGAYDPSGRLRIGFFDRSVDSANLLYTYSVATETRDGSLKFSVARVATAMSDPTTGDRWFARNVNTNFPHATAFLGDYSGIAIDPSGGVIAYWTDMRNDVTFGTRTGHGEDAYFGRTS